MNKNLTSGSPTKAVVRFGVPILLGNMFQQLFNMTDSAIVGNFVGVEALAGVGSTGSLNFMVIGFVVGLCSGFSIPIAQNYGAEDIKRLRKYFANSIWLVGIVSLILTFVTLFCLDSILVLMKTPDDIYNYAKTYIGTMFAGITGLFLYNLLASVMRAIGDSRTPLMLLVFSAVLNLLLDLLLVIVFEMGVLGTGIATVFSQSLAGVVCLIIIKKRVPILHFSKEDIKPDFKVIIKLLGLGVPMGLQFSITAIGSVVIQAATNTLGSIYVAAVTSGSRIWIVTGQMFEATGISLATFAGQNLGAGKVDRVSKGMVGCQVIGFVYSIAVFIFFWFTGGFLAQIFVDSSEVEIIKVIDDYLKITTAFFVVLSPLLILRSIIQGLGYSALAMVAGVFEMVARCIVAFFFVTDYGFTAITLANAAAWIAADVFLIPAYIYVMHKVKKKAKLAESAT